MENSLRELSQGSQGTKRQRSMLKCDFCREKKCKCLPYPRVWPGVKCDACEKAGQACGPNTHFRSSTTSSSSTATSRSLAMPVSPSSAFVTTPFSPHLSRSDRPYSPVDSLQNVPSLYTLTGETSTAIVPHSLPSASEPASRMNTWTLSPDNQADGRESPVASIKKWLVHLGELLTLLECLQHRRLAVNTIILRNAQSSSVQNVMTSLDFITHSAKHDYCTSLERIWELLKHLSLLESELYLLRMCHAIEEFVMVAKVEGKIGEPDDADDARLCRLHWEVLRKLVNTYTSQGDHPQAEQLLKKLHKVSIKSVATPEQVVAAKQVAAESMARSLRLSSKKMVDVVQRLNVPKKYLTWLNCKGNDPFPSIERATVARNSLVTKILSGTGQCDLSEADILLRRAVHIAAETADLDLLELVTQQSPQLLASRDVCSMTALCIAAYYGHTNFFKVLVGAGADLKHRDEDGRSILSIASGAGHLEIVGFILSRGISPNDDEVAACSPLHAAAAGGHLRVCEFLLERGAWADWISNWKTPVQAAQEKGHIEVASMIKEAALRPQNQTPNSRLGRPQHDIFNFTQSPSPALISPIANPPRAEPSALAPNAAIAAVDAQHGHIPLSGEPSWILAESDT